jgi:hypothetical protein
VSSEDGVTALAGAASISSEGDDVDANVNEEPGMSVSGMAGAAGLDVERVEELTIGVSRAFALPLSLILGIGTG